MKVFSIIKDILMTLSLIYLCIILTMNLGRLVLSKTAMDISAGLEKDVNEVNYQMINWKMFIDSKMKGVEEFTEYFETIKEMEWNQFKKWQRAKRKQAKKR